MRLLKRELFLITLLNISLVALLTGCSATNPVQSTTNPAQDMINPVQFIIISSMPPDGTVSAGGWAAHPPTNPYPTIQTNFKPDQKMLIGLVLDNNYHGDFSFTKVTIFNQETSQETQIVTSYQLRLYHPGDKFILPYDSVPDQPGIYQVRIYINQKIVASAWFTVS